MDYKEFINYKKFPTLWCAGCTIGIAFNSLAKAFAKLNFKKQNTTVISGIGCTGRAAGYYDLDTVHTLHGRAIPVAEGIKLANPDMNVIVFSGDGDLLGIGANHLLHSSRRNTNITVICVSNEIYGMTGGQLSPTTKKGEITLTSPFGSEIEPINVQGILSSNKKYFYARTSPLHLEHLNKCLEQALMHNGFSFVEIRTYCIQQIAKTKKISDPYQILMMLKNDYKLSEGKRKLKENELGIIEARK